MCGTPRWKPDVGALDFVAYKRQSLRVEEEAPALASVIEADDDLYRALLRSVQPDFDLE